MELEEREDQGVRKGGEEDSRGHPPCYTASHKVRSKESYIEVEKGKSTEAEDRQDNLSSGNLA